MNIHWSYEIKSRKLAEDIPRGLFGVYLHKMLNYLLTEITFFVMSNGTEEQSLHKNLSRNGRIQTRNPFKSCLWQQPTPDHYSIRTKQVYNFSLSVSWCRVWRLHCYFVYVQLCVMDFAFIIIFWTNLLFFSGVFSVLYNVCKYDVIVHIPKKHFLFVGFKGFF